jgi:hypothetical protein
MLPAIRSARSSTIQIQGLSSSHFLKLKAP